MQSETQAVWIQIRGLTFKWLGHIWVQTISNNYQHKCITKSLKVRSSLASLRCGLRARHIYPSLVLVQPRKTRPCLTKRLLMGRKESNQTNIVVTSRSLSVTRLYTRAIDWCINDKAIFQMPLSMCNACLDYFFLYLHENNLLYKKDHNTVIMSST